MSISKYFHLIILTFFLVCLCPFFSGDSLFPPFTQQECYIFWELRVPRSLVSFLCGGGLALSGLIYQSLFQNRLATPYTLGVVSASALSVSIWLFIQNGQESLWNTSTAALLGALFSILILYLFLRIRKQNLQSHLILIGVILSFFFSSITMCIQYLSSAQSIAQMNRWLMGSLAGCNQTDVLFVLPFILIGVFFAIYHSKELDLLSIDEQWAQTKGVAVSVVQRRLFLTTSLMVAAIVTICGPIGFIGLIIPHITRVFVGNNHSTLSCFAFIFGGALLTFCDSLGRFIYSQGEIPVGITTAFLGGPIFIFILLKRS